MTSLKDKNSGKRVVVEKSNGNVHVIDKASRYIFPLSFLLLNIFYFLYSFMLYQAIQTSSTLKQSSFYNGIQIYEWQILLSPNGNISMAFKVFIQQNSNRTRNHDHLFKVNNRNSRKRYEICSDLKIKTPERRHWLSSGVFIVNFKHILDFFLVFLLFTLNNETLAG